MVDFLAEEEAEEGLPSSAGEEAEVVEEEAYCLLRLGKM